ncbi:hypothetical protein EVAR_70104_1 [Eumeta japonica]|uniref:Uncharacterized protein n=1 Tax=Eumeta variegata TaxID=151549 RepID=A0A4C2AAV3_EUMVA|nr:hypothetical protein EVAR_70104_1 [Eumeta japonica]
MLRNNIKQCSATLVNAWLAAIASAVPDAARRAYTPGIRQTRILLRARASHVNDHTQHNLAKETRQQAQSPGHTTDPHFVNALRSAAKGMRARRTRTSVRSQA